jgi:hypothetical protein
MSRTLKQPLKQARTTDTMIADAKKHMLMHYALGFLYPQLKQQSICYINAEQLQFLGAGPMSARWKLDVDPFSGCLVWRLRYSVKIGPTTHAYDAEVAATPFWETTATDDDRAFKTLTGCLSLYRDGHLQDDDVKTVSFVPTFTGDDCYTYVDVCGEWMLRVEGLIEDDVRHLAKEAGVPAFPKATRVRGRRGGRRRVSAK